MFRELIEELFEAVDGNRVDELGRFFHTDVVYERPGYEPLQGRAAVLAFYANRRVIGSGKHHIERIVEEGDAAASWGRFVGTAKDGTPIDERFADCYTFEEGRIRQRRSHFFRPAV